MTSTTLAASSLPVPVRLGRPQGGGWLPAERLLDPGSPDLEQRLLRFGERVGASRRAVAASLLLEAYAGLLATVAFGGLAGAGPLPGGPDLSAGNTSLRFPPGGVPDAIALHQPRAVAPGALDELAAGLLGRHLGPLVERLLELRVGRGPRALWGLVANACAAAIVDSGSGSGTPPERVRALLDGFFGLPGSPLPAAPRLLAVPHRGGTRLLRKRVSCCLNYAIDGCDYCATCPLLDDRRATALAAERLAAAGGG